MTTFATIMRNTLIFSLVFTSLLFGCQNTQKETPDSRTPGQSLVSEISHSAAIKKVFDAHGGYERWQQMNQLTYMKGDEKTITDLKNRKILLSSSQQTIGYDGNEVWISPDTLDASNARFYHNLYFYFYAMPFVLGDPGINYEDLAPRSLNGDTYNGIKISYASGIGDSPKDNYIIWYDPETYTMEWLMYTVTYRSGEASDKYSLIKYDEWKSVNGLVLPTKLQWHVYEDDAVGDVRGEALFESVSITDEKPNQSQFRRPENSKIAPLTVQ